MAVPNPWSITYGERQVGGATDYQLHGPYVLDKSFDRLRVGFDVVVVADDFEDLQQLCDVLETDFRKRDQDLVIDLDGNTWTYTRGEHVLNTSATITKSGIREVDQGFSRAYSCVIEGELPADDTNGLRDVEVLVDYEASRQKTVTMRGTYTALSGTEAVQMYRDNFDTESMTLLEFIDSEAAFELVDESYTIDRNRNEAEVFPHVCNFQRQYVELLADQSMSMRDDPQIRDHRIIFTDHSQHPGDSQENVRRLRRVSGSFDCAVNIEETTDLQTVFDQKVRRLIVERFLVHFVPRVYGIEEMRISTDETAKRISATFTFVYQTAGGGNVVEISQSVAYREARSIDYTPVHGKDELAAEVDIGWAIVERIWSSTAVFIGAASPVLRIANGSVNSEGWNIVANQSQVTPQWIGDTIHGNQQIPVSVLSETVVERYNRRPARGTVVPVVPTTAPGPTTGPRPASSEPGS